MWLARSNRSRLSSHSSSVGRGFTGVSSDSARINRTLAEIRVVGKHSEGWIVELVAVITNKGKVQHRLETFEFDLNALDFTDPVELRTEWGNQVHFPHLITKGSFLPDGTQYFFIDPGSTARYSHVTRVPPTVQFVILHAWFEYPGKIKLHHAAETTAMLPTQSP